MKIGTKANAIDDLGKFDGSKMTIKVNGKQIYPQKRYAIVRVDHNYCPIIEENMKGCYCPQDKDRDFYCSDCKTFKNYGDTKEQLVNKIAQVIRRYRKNLEVCDYCDMKDEFEIAENVVEFLGVE